MPSEVTPIAVSDLTEATVAGTGVFDVLMRANKTHLEQEFKAGRIRGPEYSTVYLGSLQAVLNTALSFLLAQQKTELENKLVEQQIALTTVQIDKVNAEKALVDAQKALTDQQKLNAEVENTVLVAQECKLRAEFDLIEQQVLKATQETALLTQKVATERAQTQSIGVDADSVVGKQKALYTAQADGFKRDAEQKAAKVLVDTWNVRRTTDEGTVADGTNLLNDASVGRAVGKLLTGIGA